MIKKNKYLKVFLFLILAFFLQNNTYALETLGGLPAVNVQSNPEGGTTYSLSLQILMLMSFLTVLPSIVLQSPFNKPALSNIFFLVGLVEASNSFCMSFC